jgi:hypothetical protein
MGSHTKWNMERSLVKVPIVSNAFPLEKLPEPVLVNLFEVIPLFHASQQSTINKKFSNAFRNNVHWKNRCFKDIEPVCCCHSLLSVSFSGEWCAVGGRVSASKV